MNDINKVTIIGRLTKDAEMHNFNEDFGVLQFSIAVNTTTKKDGEYADKANFFNVKKPGKCSYLSNLNSLLLKGKQIAVEGHLEQDRWEKDGVKNSAVSIVAEQIQLLGSARKESDGNSNPGFEEDLPY